MFSVGTWSGSENSVFFSGVGSHALVMSGNKDQVVEWRLGNRVSQSGNEG